jgi:hypothetical protein
MKFAFVFCLCLAPASCAPMPTREDSPPMPAALPIPAPQALPRAAPSELSLISPEDGSTVNNPIMLKWEHVEGATGYDVDMDGFVLGRVNIALYSPTNYPIGEHHWRVRGANATGNGPWSATWSFIVRPPPRPWEEQAAETLATMKIEDVEREFLKALADELNSEPHSAQYRAMCKERLLDMHTDWDREAVLAVRRSEVAIGMTPIQVELSWGLPSDVHRTTTANGISVQLIYGPRRASVYLDNGVVTVIED